MHQQRVTNTYKINRTAQNKSETSAPYTMIYFGINHKKKNLLAFASRFYKNPRYEIKFVLLFLLYRE